MIGDLVLFDFFLATWNFLRGKKTDSLREEVKSIPTMCRLWLYDYFHVLMGGRASAMQGYSKTSVSRASRAVG